MPGRKNGRWKNAEEKNIKNNNSKSNFSTTANIFVKFFLRLLNLIFKRISSESFD